MKRNEDWIDDHRGHLVNLETHEAVETPFTHYIPLSVPYHPCERFNHRYTYFKEQYWKISDPHIVVPHKVRSRIWCRWYNDDGTPPIWHKVAKWLRREKLYEYMKYVPTLLEHPIPRLPWVFELCDLIHTHLDPDKCFSCLYIIFKAFEHLEDVNEWWVPFHATRRTIESSDELLFGVLVKARRTDLYRNTYLQHCNR